MIDTMHCDDKETLISYLYDEIDPVRRRQVEEHLRLCAACADELGALAGVRVGLAAWAPAQPEFGFTIVATKGGGDQSARPAAAVVPSATWWAAVPAWAQMAAAVLVLAVGAAIANVQVRSGPDGVAVTTGWMYPAGSQPAATVPVASQASAENWKPAMAALESQLRQELRATQQGTQTPVRASAPVGADDATIKRVQALLDASEGRQRRELALRLTQLNRDMDVQRRADLVRIDQGFGQFEGRTGAEIARQRQLVNYLMRVSQPPQ